MELDWEERLREAVSQRRPAIRIVWFFPIGRFILYLFSSAAVAWNMTTLPAAALGGLGSQDVLLACFTAGWVVAEAGEMTNEEHGSSYFDDVFNVIDILLILGMLLTLATRYVAAAYGVGAAGTEAFGDGVIGWVEESMYELTLPMQAMTAMLAWIRLVQVLLLDPKSGPLLLMATRMLEDLGQFLVLAAFVLVAFCASFFILFNGAAAVASGSDAIADPSLSFLTILMRLAEAALVGEPDRIILEMEAADVGDDDRVVAEAHAGARSSTFTWLMMALFGLEQVVLVRCDGTVFKILRHSNGEH